MIGERFDRLLVLEQASQRKWGQICWLCRCNCGTTKIIAGDALRRGQTRSCGCLLKDINKKKTTHGESKTRLFHIWVNMKYRCYNPKAYQYKNWGGRGIKICDAWRYDYLQFKNWALSNGYEETLTIERVNNNGNYSPDNCKWIPRKDQPKNSRHTRLKLSDAEEIRLLYADGVKQKDIAVLYKICRSYVSDIVNYKVHKPQQD